MYNREIFKPMIETFVDNDIKRFAEKCLDIVPDYFYHVPASSSGKYHPAYALGEGGLARHTLALLKILKYILDLQYMGSIFSEREEQLMLVAGMMHDTFKSGAQEEYEKSKHTKFNHPILAANAVRGIKGIIAKSEVEFCAHCIESHMGQWNEDKRSGWKLPKPSDIPQFMVHLADYLASRKDIIVTFDDIEVPSESLGKSEWNKDNWIIDFGKYKGQSKTFSDILYEEPDYLRWLLESNITREPARTILEDMKEEIRFANFGR